MEFFWLLFGHFLADLPLQGEWVCKEKGRVALFMFGHCVIWAGVISLVLMGLDLFSAWKLWFLFVTHYAMDKTKCVVIDKINREHPIAYDEFGFIKDSTKKKKIIRWVYGDQLFHLGQLLVVYYV